PRAAYWAPLKRSIHHRSGAVPARTAVITWVASPVPEDGTLFTVILTSGCSSRNASTTWASYSRMLPPTPHSTSSSSLRSRRVQPDSRPPPAAARPVAPAPPRTPRRFIAHLRTSIETSQGDPADEVPLEHEEQDHQRQDDQERGRHQLVELDVLGLHLAEALHADRQGLH